jgi:hypothetical protein
MRNGWIAWRNIKHENLDDIVKNSCNEKTGKLKQKTTSVK